MHLNGIYIDPEVIKWGMRLCTALLAVLSYKMLEASYDAYNLRAKREGRPTIDEIVDGYCQERWGKDLFDLIADYFER